MELGAGFRAGRGTVDPLFVIRQLSEKFFEKNRIIYNNFTNYRQAFDSVWQQGSWQVLRNYGIPENMVKLLEDLYNTRSSAVAKRPRDASCLYSVNTRRRAQSIIISC